MQRYTSAASWCVTGTSPDLCLAFGCQWQSLLYMLSRIKTAFLWGCECLNDGSNKGFCRLPHGSLFWRHSLYTTGYIVQLSLWKILILKWIYVYIWILLFETCENIFEEKHKLHMTIINFCNLVCYTCFYAVWFKGAACKKWPPIKFQANRGQHIGRVGL